MKRLDVDREEEANIMRSEADKHEDNEEDEEEEQHLLTSTYILGIFLLSAPVSSHLIHGSPPSRVSASRISEDKHAILLLKEISSSFSSSSCLLILSLLSSHHLHQQDVELLIGSLHSSLYLSSTTASPLPTTTPPSLPPSMTSLYLY